MMRTPKKTRSLKFQQVHLPMRGTTAQALELVSLGGKSDYWSPHLIGGTGVYIIFGAPFVLGRLKSSELFYDVNLIRCRVYSRLRSLFWTNMESSELFWKTFKYKVL